MDILEELWYGDVCPIAQTGYRNEEYRGLVRLYERNEGELLAALNDAQKQQLQKMQEQMGEMRNITECSAFITGFRLAARLLSEALSG